MRKITFIILTLIIFYSCGKSSKKVAKDAVLNDSSSYNQNVADIYNLISDSNIYAPKIKYSKKWKEWIFSEDVNEEEYSSYEDYLKEAEYTVSVNTDKNYLEFTSQDSISIISAKLFSEDDNSIILGYIDSDLDPQNQSDDIVRFFSYNKTELKNTSSQYLPGIEITDFFDNEVNHQLLKKHKIISLRYSFSPENNLLNIKPQEVFGYRCNISSELYGELIEEDHKEICQLWTSYNPKLITSTLENGKFVINADSKEKNKENKIFSILNNNCWLHASPADRIEDDIYRFYEGDSIKVEYYYETNGFMVQKGHYSWKNDSVLTVQWTKGWKDNNYVESGDLEKLSDQELTITPLGHENNIPTVEINKRKFWVHCQ